MEEEEKGELWRGADLLGAWIATPIPEATHQTAMGTEMSIRYIFTPSQQQELREERKGGFAFHQQKPARNP